MMFISVGFHDVLLSCPGINSGQVFPARISVFIMRIPGYAAAIDDVVLASQPTPISFA